MTVFAAGFYFPLFYIQLDALTHGLDKTYAFYSVMFDSRVSNFGDTSNPLLNSL